MKDRIISSSVFLTRILESYTVLSTVNDSVFWRSQLTSDWYRNASAGQHLPVGQRSFLGSCIFKSDETITRILLITEPHPGQGFVTSSEVYRNVPMLERNVDAVSCNAFVNGSCVLFIRDRIKRSHEVRPSNPHFLGRVNTISQIKTLKSAPTAGLASSSFPQMTSSGDSLFRLTLQISPLETRLKSRHTSQYSCTGHSARPKLASRCVTHRMGKVTRQESTEENRTQLMYSGVGLFTLQIKHRFHPHRIGHPEQSVRILPTFGFQEPIVNLIQIVTVQSMCHQPRCVKSQRKETYSGLNGSINRFLRERCQDR